MERRWTLLLTLFASLVMAAPAFEWSAGAPDQPAGVDLRGATASELEGQPVVRCDAKDGGLVAPTLGDGWPTLTLAALVYLEQPKAGYQGILCRDPYGGPKGDVCSLLVDANGAWATRLVTTKGSFALSAPAEAGWHLVALSYDGKQVVLAVDGQVRQRKAAAGELVTIPDTKLVLGAYSNFQGQLKGGVARALVDQPPLDDTALAALWEAWRPKLDPNRGFSFSAASDLHVTDTKSVEIINDGVDRINADPTLAFSLWVGDLTQSSKADEMFLAKLTLARLTKPWHTVRGNHDQSGGFYEQQFGELHQRFDYGGWRFLLCDTNPGDATPMSADEQAWLKARVAETPAEMPLVLVCHHPLMPHTKSYHLAGAEEVLALFKGNALKAVINGHYHGNQEETVDGVLFTTTACLATTRNNFDGTTAKGYRVFHCRHGEITTEFVPVREEQPKG